MAARGTDSTRNDNDASKYSRSNYGSGASGNRSAARSSYNDSNYDGDSASSSAGRVNVGRATPTYDRSAYASRPQSASSYDSQDRSAYDRSAYGSRGQSASRQPSSSRQAGSSRGQANQSSSSRQSGASRQSNQGYSDGGRAAYPAQSSSRSSARDARAMQGSSRNAQGAPRDSRSSRASSAAAGSQGASRYSRQSGSYGSGSGASSYGSGSGSGSGSYGSNSYGSDQNGFSPEFVDLDGDRGKLSKKQLKAEKKAAKKAKKANKGKGGKVIKIILIIILVLLLGGGGAAFWYINKINKNLGGDKTDDEKLAISEKLKATSNFKEPFYVILIGTDARADDPGMGARSDTNVLCRVDAVNGIVTMLSIPRDTRISIDGYGYCKFNAAYTYGGTAGTIDAASKLCGVDISDYVEVNFEKLQDLIDAVGGVDVDVQVEMNDPEHYGSLVIPTGMQHLDGATALAFARSRNYPDGDFTRTANQRTLIKALAVKILSLPPTQLPSAIQAAASCVSTSFTVTDLYSLAVAFQDILLGTDSEDAQVDNGSGCESGYGPNQDENEGLTIYTSMVPSTTAMIDDVSYVLCDEAGLREVMALIEQGKNPKDATTTGQTGSAVY